VDRITETFILRFFDRMCVILETQELFPKAYLTHQPMYAYLPLFISSWNIQEHWDSDLFCLGCGRICGGFPPLCVLYKSARTCHFFYCTPELHFLRRIFWAHQKSGNLLRSKVTRFSWNPLIPLLHHNKCTQDGMTSLWGCISRTMAPWLDRVEGKRVYMYRYSYVIYAYV